MKKKLLSVVVPVYFEEKGLNELYNRLFAVLNKLKNEINYEIILVNDGSTDNSWNIIKTLSEKDKNLVGINLSRNFGHQIAVTAGMDFSRGDAVVIIDDDLQDPPEVIEKMYDKWKEGYDVVYGVRSKRKGEKYWKLAASSLFYRLLNKLSDYKIPNDVGDFRLIDKKVVKELLTIREENRYIRGLISWIGFKQIGLEYVRDARYAGRSNYSLRKLLNFAYDGIISFSNKPLKLSAYFGVLIIFISILYSTFIVYSKIKYPDSIISGWTSMMIVILCLSGVQLLSLGIIGQYIARIYTEVKNRPLYVISELRSSKGGKSKI